MSRPWRDSILGASIRFLIHVIKIQFLSWDQFSRYIYFLFKLLILKPENKVFWMIGIRLSIEFFLNRKRFISRILFWITSSCILYLYFLRIKLYRKKNSKKFWSNFYSTFFSLKILKELSWVYLSSIQNNFSSLFVDLSKDLFVNNSKIQRENQTLYPHNLVEQYREGKFFERNLKKMRKM